MAIGLHVGGPMLDVWSRAPRATRRVAFLTWSLFVLLPALASAQTTVTAIWDPSPPSEQVSTYEVCIGTSSRSCNIRLASVSASQTSYVFAPPAGQIVYVAVRALNSSGRGNYSLERTFSIPSFSALTNRSTSLLSAILPISLAVSDPDGSPLTFTHTGLPPGVTLNTSTGQITGTPTSAGTFNVTVFVSDGLVTVSRSFLWTVTTGTTTDRTAPALTITSHTSGLVVTSASQTIRGTATDSGKGGSGITIVRVNGQSATGGTASGSNTANWSRTLTLNPGSNTISVEAVDGAGNIQMLQITLQLTTSTSSSTSTSGGTTTTGGPLSVTSLTSSRTSPQPPGTLITFTAGASGGTGPYQFKWLVFDGEVWTVARNWGTSSTYTWSAMQTSSAYQIGVWVRDSTMTSNIGTYNRSMPFVVSSSSSSLTPLTVTALSASRISPQPVGTSITFTATATGGRSPYQYKWWLFNGTTWTLARDWSSSATWAWTPTQPGSSYQVGVWVRDSTMTSDIGTYNKAMTFAISGTSTSSTTTSSTTSGPLRITAVTSNLASPQLAGTRVTFTASAAGGIPPYQYKWWVFDGTVWIVGRDWSTSNTYTWTALPRGSNYVVAVWLRDSTTKANVGNINYSVPFVTR